MGRNIGLHPLLLLSIIFISFLFLFYMLTLNYKRFIFYQFQVVVIRLLHKYVKKYNTNVISIQILSSWYV